MKIDRSDLEESIEELLDLMDEFEMTEKRAVRTEIIKKIRTVRFYMTRYLNQLKKLWLKGE